MMKKNYIRSKKGFTLIELIVTIAIVAMLATVGLVSLQGARGSARDAKRRADLESIRGAFELFYSDCGQYPQPNGTQVRSPIRSSDSSVASVNCPAASPHIYMTEVPTDPSGSPMFYYYARPSGITSFVLCTHLERSTDPVPANCPANCGGGEQCNYSIAGP